MSYEALEQLAPEARRYDVAVQSGLVLSVHPNGFKTWVFVYDQNARLRRRTLGVFPDMAPKQARRALRDARTRLHTFDDAPRSSLPAPTGPLLVQDIVETLDELANTRNAIVLATVLLATAAGWIWMSAPIPATPEPTQVEVAARTSSRLATALTPVDIAAPPAQEVPAQAVLAPASTLEAQLDEPVPQALAQSVAPDLLSAIETEASIASAAPSDTLPEPPSVSEPIAALPAPAPSKADATDSLISAGPPDEKLASTDPIARVALSGDDQLRHRGNKDLAPSSIVVAGAAPLDIPADDSTALTSPVTASPATTPEQDTALPAMLALVETTEEQTWLPGSQVYSDRVTRAVLTRGVVNREPTETLPTFVQPEGEQPVKVYYFTEFGDMAGEQVHYRWTHRGRVIAEVPVNIGNAWRWRSYSQKDIRPDQTGEWLVSVLDSEGLILAQAGFTMEEGSVTQDTAQP